MQTIRHRHGYTTLVAAAGHTLNVHCTIQLAIVSVVITLMTLQTTMTIPNTIIITHK